MTSKSQNVLRLLQLLQSGRWKVKDLAAELGVGARSVHRYVAEIRAAGYEVESEIGPNGYVRIRERSAAWAQHTDKIVNAVKAIAQI